MGLLSDLGVELPVVQAGMGGGVSRHELAAAVSDAGGLGTLGMASPEDLAAELRAAREQTRRPIAVNLLLPFVRARHWEIASDADLVVTFWGTPERRVPGRWAHQCGSVEEARAAVAAGADGVIVQGSEAGGHVRGTTAAHELLGAIRSALPSGVPLWLAGGIADRADVLRALEVGAEAAVLGTRFVMSAESRAHPAYKARLATAHETFVTDLFGAGWPAPHRVVANAATDRRTSSPAWMRALQRATAPVLARAPEALAGLAVARQRPGAPLLTPQPPVDDLPDSLLDAGPLYAGETVARIEDVSPAAELVRALAP